MKVFSKRAFLFAIVASVAATSAFAQGWTDDGTVVRLTTSSDLVGIGTTGPLTKVHVETVGKSRGQC